MVAWVYGIVWYGFLVDLFCRVLRFKTYPVVGVLMFSWWLLFDSGLDIVVGLIAGWKVLLQSHLIGLLTFYFVCWCCFGCFVFCFGLDWFLYCCCCCLQALLGVEVCAGLEFDLRVISFRVGLCASCL